MTNTQLNKEAAVPFSDEQTFPPCQNAKKSNIIFIGQSSSICLFDSSVKDWLVFHCVNIHYLCVQFHCLLQILKLFKLFTVQIFFWLLKTFYRNLHLPHKCQLAVYCCELWSNIYKETHNREEKNNFEI